jgi:glycine/D-amino acid oxidase-like deaminating enzyme
VVNAAGAWVDDVAAMVGLRIPMKRLTAIVSVTEPAPPVMHGLLVQHVSRGLTLKQAPRGNFVIGGGWPAILDTTTGRKIATLESILGNLAVAARTAPILRELRLLRTWAGLGADSADVSPMIGESERVRGFYVLESSFGFTLGPLSARLLSEQLLTGTPSLPIGAFSPNRF